MKKKFSSIKSNSNNKSNSNIISNSDLSLMSNTNNNNIKILSLPKLPISNISPNILRKKFLCQSISVKSNNEICSELLNKSTMINNNKKLTIKHYKSKSLNNSNNQNNNDLKKIKSELYFYKVPQIVLFHKKLMLKNEKTCLIRFNRELSSENLKDKMKKIKLEKIKEKKEFNIYEQIKQIQEDIKYKKDYKKRGMEPEIKNILKNELEEAKEKLKIKDKLNINKFKIPIIEKKLARYKCISYQNQILEINEYGTLPTYIKDGKLMYKLFYEGSESCKKEKYKVHF